jgi:hypothetical protein
MRARTAQREIAAALFARCRHNRRLLGMKLDGLALVFDLAAKDARRQYLGQQRCQQKSQMPITSEKVWNRIAVKSS